MNEAHGSSAAEAPSDQAPPTQPPPSELVERAAEVARAAIARVPPLAVLAVVAALVELFLARAAWHALTEVWPAADVLELRRWARFPRNLAAVAGLVALTASLFGFLRLPGYAPIGRRLSVAAFAGVFVPSVAVTAVLAPEHVRRKLVVFSLAAANVLVTLVALTAVRYRAELALRLAAALASASAFFSLLAVGLTQLAQAESGFWHAVGIALVESSGGGEPLVMAVRHVGELCWMGVLLACTVAVVRDGLVTKARARVAAILVLALVTTAALVTLRSGMGPYRFGLLLFGTFQLSLFVGAAPAFYAFPLGLGLASGLAGLLRPEPSLRQLGAGLLLWLVAGVAPHTPIQLLYMVLGALLLSRAAQARDGVSGWTLRQPWARWTGPRRG